MIDLERALRRFLDDPGNTDAFEAIVNATSARLVRLGARMLGNVADAEDVVQEAYVKAHRSLLEGQFDGRSKVETWLYRIVVNGAIDAKRKRARAKTVPTEDEGEFGAFESEGGLDAKLALRELHEWIADLPEDQATALVLKAVEGLDSKEIAEILDVSEGAVEQRLVRARATLRNRRNAS
ncbi:MAG: RNA polymerase sigma factor [Polyangiaceae bacterium]